MRDDIVFVIDGGSNFILSIGAPAFGKAAMVEKTHGTRSIKVMLNYYCYYHHGSKAYQHQLVIHL